MNYPQDVPADCPTAPVIDHIEDAWRQLTDNGKADGRVQGAANLVHELRSKLRARYNIKRETLAELDEFTLRLTREIKESMVASRGLYPAVRR